MANMRVDDIVCDSWEVEVEPKHITAFIRVDSDWYDWEDLNILIDALKKARRTLKENGVV